MTGILFFINPLQDGQEMIRAANTAHKSSHPCLLTWTTAPSLITFVKFGYAELKVLARNAISRLLCEFCNNLPKRATCPVGGGSAAVMTQCPRGISRLAGSLVCQFFRLMY